MSRTIARLLLTVLLMPVMIVVYITAIVSIWEVFNLYDARAFAYSGVATGLLAMVGWLGIWGTSVQWSRARVWWTVASVVTLTLAGVAVGALLEFTVLVSDGFGSFIGAAVAILGWLIATVFIWREAAHERAERLARTGIATVACPGCGYNLTGLKTTTCPECGGSFTVQELAAAARGVGELDS